MKRLAQCLVRVKGRAHGRIHVRGLFHNLILTVTLGGRLDRCHRPHFTEDLEAPGGEGVARGPRLASPASLSLPETSGEGSRDSLE